MLSRATQNEGSHHTQSKPADPGLATMPSIFGFTSPLRARRAAERLAARWPLFRLSGGSEVPEVAGARCAALPGLPTQPPLRKTWQRGSVPSAVNQGCHHLEIAKQIQVL